LLKGLEVHISLLSEVASNERLDSQYFLKELVENDNKIESKPHDLISDLGLVTDGNHLTIAENFEQNGIRYLRGQDISSRMMLDERNAVFIPETEYDKLSRSHIFKDDVLITIVGANTGQTALVYNPPSKLTANCKLGFARVDKTKINPAFLHIFLVSKFGQNHIQRRIRGGGQTGLILPDLRNLKIPRFSNLLETEIAKLNLESHSKDELSKQVYINAVERLLEVLELNNWQPTEEAKAIKKFSQSFATSGRLDAEYYQPKFDEVLEVISKVKHKSLGSIASFKKSIEPGSDAYQTEGVPFIRVSDISKFGLSEPEIHLDREIYNDETLKPKKDTILLSKDGSVGIAYKVEQDLDVITSSALLHLTITDKEVLPDYLTLVLNSKLTQMQAERDAGGSIIQHWRPDEIKQVQIPVLPMDTQIELVKQIQQSFKLRQESTILIYIAKQAVEIAIEQDEQTALKFINENIDGD